MMMGSMPRTVVSGVIRIGRPHHHVRGLIEVAEVVEQEAGIELTQDILVLL